MIRITVPEEGDMLTPDTFRWFLDWELIRKARVENAGSDLLRTNMFGCDTTGLWEKYFIRGELEHVFRDLKNNLGLSPSNELINSKAPRWSGASWQLSTAASSH